MSRPAIEVADIFRRYGDDYRQTYGGEMSHKQWLVMNAIESCRTAALGGHLEHCDCCEYRRNVYNSCRDRHCPKCQSLARQQWLDDRQAELLPTPYFHVVFTLPAAISALALQNKRVLYNLLFRATAETLRTIAADPKHLGAEIGVTAVLHTWGQNLLHHVHLHCIVPAGGLSPDQAHWIGCRPGFFLPVRVLSRRFRTVFLDALQQAFETDQLSFFGDLEVLQDQQEFHRYLAPLRSSEWVVYAKPPFGDPDQVMAYLGSYTHRVAISNHRLVSAEQGKVAFRWRDYRHQNRQKIMTLDANEFIRRFLLHTLPHGFQRIRYFGFFSNRQRKQKLTNCRELLNAPTPPEESAPRIDYRDLFEQLTGQSLRDCPQCGKGQMVTFATLARRPRRKYFDSS